MNVAKPLEDEAEYQCERDFHRLCGVRVVDGGQGFRFVTVRSDAQLMASGAHEVISTMKDEGG